MFKRAYIKSLGKGVLCTFQYLGYKHDPQPLALITSIYSGPGSAHGNIAAVNLHYLSLPYVRNILKIHCDNTNFSYPMIKHDQFIKASFRTYKPSLVRNLHILDCSYIISLMKTSMRSFRPNELEKIQQNIREQLQNKQNPRADEMAGQYTDALRPHAHDMFKQDNRLAPNLASPQNIPKGWQIPQIKPLAPPQFPSGPFGL